MPLTTHPPPAHTEGLDELGELAHSRLEATGRVLTEAERGRYLG